ncbi:MAG: four helix bundle protein [Planctomycetota bacterium]
MSEFVASFRDLDVYKRAYAAATEIFELSKSFPPEEQYALTTQIRKASRSVCSCIGEAWGKRRYPKHFASKLTDSDSEGNETTVWLDFAFDHGYIDEPTHDRLMGEYKHIGNQLNRMINDPESWSI